MISVSYRNFNKQFFHSQIIYTRCSTSVNSSLNQLTTESRDSDQITCQWQWLFIILNKSLTKFLFFSYLIEKSGLKNVMFEYPPKLPTIKKFTGQQTKCFFFTESDSLCTLKNQITKHT